MAKREALLTQTFVELADTLVENFDVIELLSVLASRTVSLLDAGAAGILLIDQHGTLQVMGASTEQARLLELGLDRHMPVLLELGHHAADQDSEHNERKRFEHRRGRIA